MPVLPDTSKTSGHRPDQTPRPLLFRQSLRERLLPNLLSPGLSKDPRATGLRLLFPLTFGQCRGPAHRVCEQFDTSPSEADIRVTRDLIKAGQMLKMELLDHLVISQSGAYSSLRELGYFGPAYN
jgi:hypothetical protein